MNDEKLIKKAICGDKRAEAQIYRQYKSRLLNYIKQKASPEVAQELMQETFISVFKSLPTFKGRSKFFSWMCSIARHEVADYYRKKKLKTMVFSKLPFLKGLVSEALGPDLALEEKQLKSRVKEALLNINEGYSQVLRLKYWQEMSMKQIAKKGKTTVKAVESKLSRARKAFKDEFKKTEKKYLQVCFAPWD